MMDFTMIKEFDWNLSKDKIKLGVYVDNDMSYIVTLAYFNQIEDFDMKDEYKIIYNTDSIQIRPKAIYKNKDGYYRKKDNKRFYFDKAEVERIEKAISKYKNYLTSKQ